MIKVKNISAAACALLCFVLSSCGSGDGEITDTSISDETVFETAFSETETYIASENETAVITAETVQTASEEDIQKLIDSAERPEIIISEDSSAEEIMLAGETAAAYFAGASEEFFGYGIEYDWKLDYEEIITLDGIDGIAPYLVNQSYRKASGYYTDRENGIYAPMDYEAAKKFIMSRIGMTEHGFDELCSISPSSYIGINGALYVNSGDGGQAGWSRSEIIGYELGESSVTYNCQRVGKAEDWGYEEDIIMPFTFRLALEDSIWKLDGVSCGEGFFELKRLQSETYE